MRKGLLFATAALSAALLTTATACSSACTKAGIK